jgi:glycerol-3-phosphate O-acyltransferase / dihydroxyacetone phosphate acyltransferase
VLPNDLAVFWHSLKNITIQGGTIGRKRHVSFWAKSSLFKVPVIRNIVRSAGAIPVERNPNKATPSSTSATSVQGTLFESTSKALHNDAAICIFPEGSSSTEPSLALLYDGISYAALEFALWESKRLDGSNQHGPKSKKLRIVPVGTVYTNKTSFRSRVSGSGITSLGFTCLLFSASA